MKAKVTDAGNHAPRVSAFLAAIRAMPHITRAAKAAGIRREMHYRRYKSDAAYTAAFDEAWQIGVGAVEDLAMEIAMEGWEEPVVFQGQISLREDPRTGKIVPVTIRKRDHGMVQFVLRGALPTKYRERFQVKATINDKRFAGTLEELLELYKKLQAAGDEDDEDE